MAIYGEPQPPYPERYTKGVWLFNERHFFECHEILEELWLESIGTEKVFYQMVIHAAVCFVHWENGNRKGVLSLHRTFVQKAGEVPAERYMGLDIRGMLAGMEALVGPLRDDETRPLPPFDGLATPRLQVHGFEPTPVGEKELLVLGRHIEPDDEA